MPPTARTRPLRLRAIHVQIAAAAVTTLAALIALGSGHAHPTAPDAAGVRTWVTTHR